MERERANRYRAFVSELEQLSARHGVVLSVTGAVDIYDGPLASVTYDEDHTSGDLNPTNIKELEEDAGMQPRQ